VIRCVSLASLELSHRVVLLVGSMNEPPLLEAVFGVLVWLTLLGAMSHLLRGLLEQNYSHWT